MQAETLTAAELIEKARAQSREIEELKKVMDSPDRNLRLAAFQLMMDSDNPVYRELAIESGLSSTDNLLRSQALKTALFNMNALYVDLAIDQNAPKDAQEASANALAEGLPRIVIDFTQKHPETDSIDIRTGNAGGSEIQGINYVFHASGRVGTLTLKDGALLQGPVTISDRRYIGTARLR
ncbi:hypothetical protein T31B1_04180 [Salinisphaera sp. T31B1]